MKHETTYNKSELKRRKCKSCGLRTLVVPDDGRCPDCIEEQIFIEQCDREFGGREQFDEWDSYKEEE